MMPSPGEIAAGKVTLNANEKELIRNLCVAIAEHNDQRGGQDFHLHLDGWAAEVVQVVLLCGARAIERGAATYTNPNLDPPPEGS